MLNQQFLSYNKPLAPCSHHVVACDDLVSPKHDEAISGAACVHPGGEASSLSVCWALEPKRSAASCIFSLMNSLLSLFSPPSFREKPFPKTPRFLTSLEKRKKKNKHHTKLCFLDMKLGHQVCNSLAVPTPPEDGNNDM